MSKRNSGKNLLTRRRYDGRLVRLEQHPILMTLLQLSLQKMLMKQQERLEEREQDIEDQLYKLESDKRLVEVVNPEHRWGDGGVAS